jgi:diphthamide biosynthesis enzyme Dph1/Dph2-like protein
MFELELETCIQQITQRKAKHVLIQLPDGLKTKAQLIVDTIEEQTDAVCFLWFSSCFGACDIPLGLTPLKIDLLIQFGHNRYHKSPDQW